MKESIVIFSAVQMHSCARSPGCQLISVRPVTCRCKSSPACAPSTQSYSWPPQHPEGGEGEQMHLLFRYFYDPSHPPTEPNPGSPRVP